MKEKRKRGFLVEKIMGKTTVKKILKYKENINLTEEKPKYETERRKQVNLKKL